MSLLAYSYVDNVAVAEGDRLHAVNSQYTIRIFLLLSYCALVFIFVANVHEANWKNCDIKFRNSF